MAGLDQSREGFRSVADTYRTYPIVELRPTHHLFGNPIGPSRLVREQWGKVCLGLAS